jgi:hypothetical protein
VRTSAMLLILVGGQLVAQRFQGPDACNSPLDTARITNSAMLEATVDLDRSEYLSKETMSISVSFRNPTSQPLEVYDPWQRRGIGMEVAPDVVGPDGGRQLSAEMPGILWNCWGTTTVFQPGEVSRRQFRSVNPLGPGLEMLSVTSRGAPPPPGAYVVALHYRNRPFIKAFTVAAPVVQQYTRLKLATPDVVQNPDGTTKQYDRFVNAYILGLGGERYVALDSRWRGSLLSVAQGANVPALSSIGP